MAGVMCVKNRFRTALIDCGDVLYVEQSKRKIVVHTVVGEFWEYCSMEAMLVRQDGRMYRCHHSLAINMDMIVSVSKQGVELSDGSTVAMGHEAIWRTKKAWAEHLLER